MAVAVAAAREADDSPWPEGPHATAMSRGRRQDELALRQRRVRPRPERAIILGGLDILDLPQKKKVLALATLE
jgi:hypothetical protein